MKKFFAILAAGLFLFAACEPTPVLSLDKTVLGFSAEGGSQTVGITANNVWYVRDDVRGGNFFCTVTPTEGTANGYITITVEPNNTGESRMQSIYVTCESRGESVTQMITINQICPVGSASIKIDEIVNADGEKVSASGGVIKMTVTANAPWTMFCVGDVEFNVSGGDAGTTAVEVTVPVNPGLEDRDLYFQLSCKTAAGGVDVSAVVVQAGGILVYAGETYKVKKMKDGKWWMTENLRYVPNGRTPSSDAGNVLAGIYYPLVYENGAAVFSTSSADIKERGYLYQSEVALGLSLGDITTEEKAKAVEGRQGICPEGWHVPTKADIVSLVGKSVGAATNPEAPYYDGANGSIAMLNADGFNMHPWGAVTINDLTKTTGTLMGALKGYEWLASGFYCGSSFASITYNTKDDPGSGIKNVMFTGFMPMTNKATEAEYTCNGSNVGFRSAASLRCVKDNN